VLGVRRWRELVIDRENGEVLLDRPKPTVGCSADGRRRSRKRSSGAGSEKMERVGDR